MNTSAATIVTTEGREPTSRLRTRSYREWALVDI
jgi:hypothetical protein